MGKAAQVIVRIDPGVVAVAPSEMQRVIADDVDLRGFELRGDLSGLNETIMRPFIDAGRAPTGQPQLTTQVNTGMAIAPEDRQLILVRFDFFRNRFHPTTSLCMFAVHTAQQTVATATS